MQMDVSAPEATVVAENVLFAVFQPGENGVFYVTEAQPPNPGGSHYAGGAFGGCGGGALAASQEGLVVTAGGTDSLYLPASACSACRKRSRA